MEHLKASLAKLVRETSVNLPPDVRRALDAAMKAETPATQSSLAAWTTLRSASTRRRAVARQARIASSRAASSGGDSSSSARS